MAVRHPYGGSPSGALRFLAAHVDPFATDFAQVLSLLPCVRFLMAAFLSPHSYASVLMSAFFCRLLMSAISVF